MGADGKAVDVAASARKLAESYTALEQKLGTGELAPKSPDEYQLTADGLPDTVKLEQLQQDPKIKEFLKAAHAKGLTNSQVQFAIAEFYKTAGSLLAGDKALTADEVIGQLRETWKDDAAFKQNMGLAFKAATALAKKAGVDWEAAGLGDNPAFIRLMAAIGSEVGEAGLPGAGEVPGAETVADLMSGEAYWNPKHADHKRVTAKVQAYYASKYGNQPVV